MENPLTSLLDNLPDPAAPPTLYEVALVRDLARGMAKAPLAQHGFYARELRAAVAYLHRRGRECQHPAADELDRLCGPVLRATDEQLAVWSAQAHPPAVAGG